MVEKTFRKEFVNRLDRVIVFQPLGRDLMRRILQRELDTVFRRRGLRSRSWAVEYDEAAIDFLLDKGFTRDLGARPLKRAVERYLLSPLAITIVNHQAPEGDQFLFVTRMENGLDVQFVDPDAPADTGESEARADGASVADEQGLLRAIALSPRGAPAELDLMRTHYARLNALAVSEGWSERKSAALSLMEEPDFWNSPERFDLLGQAEYQDRTEAGIRRAGSLLQRLERGGGSAPRGLLQTLGHNLYLLEAACGDIEDNRPREAYLLVEGGGDGSADAEESAAFAAELGRMYIAWTKKRRMQMHVLENRARSPERGSRLVAAVSGFGAWSILSGETGIHVLESPADKGKGFARCKAHVRVALQSAEPVTGDAASLRRAATAAFADDKPGRPKIVRRYRREPSPVVRDSVHGWRTGRLDVVLGGDFDLIEPN